MDASAGESVSSNSSFASSESVPYFQLQNYTPYPTSYLRGATRSAIVYGATISNATGNGTLQVATRTQE